jgi:serine/threonine-protein kinase HipA
MPSGNSVDLLLHGPDDRAGSLGFGRNVEPPAPEAGCHQSSSSPQLGYRNDLYDVATEERPASMVCAAPWTPRRR